MRGNLKWYPLCSVPQIYDFPHFFTTFYLNVLNFQANDAYPNYCMFILYVYIMLVFLALNMRVAVNFKEKGCRVLRKKPPNCWMF